MITVFANMSNGTEEQFKVIGDNNKILDFIEKYNGNDLGNDLFCEDFIEDFESTGVILEK
tara:strand:+ start:239 stop:418 length:180 start_codon:yes stop_codon:yes gene_type:complete